MKTNIFKSLLVILSLFVSCYALGEDFVTVYFHDGTHKKLFLNDVSQIKLSKTDLNNISHGDFQTQMIETSEGTYLQDLSQIDSVVFSREALNFPQTDEGLWRKAALVRA